MYSDFCIFVSGGSKSSLTKPLPYFQMMGVFFFICMELHSNLVVGEDKIFQWADPWMIMMMMMMMVVVVKIHLCVVHRTLELC